MPSIGDNDDDWAELARELSRDNSQPAVDPPPTTEEMGLFGEGAEELSAPVEEPGDLSETGGESGSEGPPDGQPGTGRKRRRRRRRRRRGGEQSAESLGAEASEGDEPEAAESSEEEQEPSEVGYSDDEGVDSELVVDVDGDEDAGEELLRELIASWNVPSWDDVVAGLYRPER